VILIADVHRSESAANFARRLLESLAQPIQAAGQDIFITASAGIAVCPNDGETVDTLLRNADVAVRHAKDEGGNGFRFYSKEMNERALDRLNLETRLNRALEHQELSLFFQPQIDLGSGHTVGFEALLRWHPADRAPVPPNEFIPIAEETGLIIPIGEWVLHAACAQLNRWKKQGHRLRPLAVNLSARQFTQPNLAQTVCEALSTNAIEPRYLELELTESVIMRDADASRRQLEALKQLGVRLAIDDFGTGYSSMSYLKRFPLDTLKIDRSFIRDLSANPTDRDIVSAIVALGKSLKLTTIAEGVETVDQRTTLAELGCNQFQGFLVSRPVPASELAAFFALAAEKPSCGSG
jgi:predicted signal transduction protein with EAL and GGDEF domain